LRRSANTNSDANSNTDGHANSDAYTDGCAERAEQPDGKCGFG
jgi:hypothetical protein